MDCRQELVLRCARKRAAKLGDLSPQAFEELLAAVGGDVDRYVDDDEERAFQLACRAIDRYDSEGDDDDLLDDDEYLRVRRQRLDRVASGADAALALDPHCATARLLQVLAADKDPDATLDLLLELDEEVVAKRGPLAMPASGDAWEDVFERDRLRIEAAAARACLETARYRMAATLSENLMQASPSDLLGARCTCSLAYARLEDEKSFDDLDARYGRRGNAWIHLGRVLLMYKLDRMQSARRALMGYTLLCVGGAYVLARPAFVDTYIPDRPMAKPGSFEEATLAVHEADPIIVDTPDFIPWVMSQRDFLNEAKSFADREGFDW